MTTFIIGDKWDSRVRVTRVQLCTLTEKAYPSWRVKIEPRSSACLENHLRQRQALSDLLIAFHKTKEAGIKWPCVIGRI